MQASDWLSQEICDQFATNVEPTLEGILYLLLEKNKTPFLYFKYYA